MERMAPSERGARSEMAVASALQRAGMDVFVPLFAAHSRIDLVAAGPGSLLRIQCKTARLLNGSLYFRTHSNTKNVPLDYRDEVDSFGVHSPELALVYVVPVDAVPRRGCNLRIEPPRNGQRSQIRWATEFVVGPP